MAIPVEPIRLPISILFRGENFEVMIQPTPTRTTG
jgi:hypothetical protein